MKGFHQSDPWRELARKIAREHQPWRFVRERMTDERKAELQARCQTGSLNRKHGFEGKAGDISRQILRACKSVRKALACYEEGGNE